MLLAFCDWLVYDRLGIDPESLLGKSIHFFVYDSIKILGLLFALIFVIGFLRTWLPLEKIKTWMTRNRAFGYVFAAFFGAVTPFCSCSSIPIFIGLLNAGIPLGASFSFLITSPLINEYLVVLMLGFFGWKITTVYVLSGLTLGIVIGAAISAMNLEGCLERDVVTPGSAPDKAPIRAGTLKARFKSGWKEAVDVFRKIWIWVLMGVAAGAVIHNYIPETQIQEWTSKAGYGAVPLAVVLGVPMYGSCAAIVPIAVVLFQKGMPLGTALSFMMAVSALSLPEAIMLRRAMNLKLIAVFFGATSLAIMATGYLINALQSHLT